MGSISSPKHEINNQFFFVAQLVVVGQAFAHCGEHKKLLKPFTRNGIWYVHH